MLIHTWGEANKTTFSVRIGGEYTSVALFTVFSRVSNRTMASDERGGVVAEQSTPDPTPGPGGARHGDRAFPVRWLELMPVLVL